MVVWTLSHTGFFSRAGQHDSFVRIDALLLAGTDEPWQNVMADGAQFGSSASGGASTSRTLVEKGVRGLLRFGHSDLEPEGRFQSVVELLVIPAETVPCRAAAAIFLSGKIGVDGAAEVDKPVLLRMGLAHRLDASIPLLRKHMVFRFLLQHCQAECLSHRNDHRDCLR